MNGHGRHAQRGRGAFAATLMLVACAPVVALAQAGFDDLLFSDEFNSMNTGVWTVFDGDWTVQDGYLRQSIDDRSISRILCGHPEWTNYRISLDIYFEDDDYNDPQGVILRYVDDRNYYRVGFNPKSNDVTFHRVEDGVVSQIGSATCALPIQEWTNVEIEAVGTSFAVYKSSELMHEFDDTRFTYGQTGLFTVYYLGWTDMPRFDNFQVYGDGELVIEPQETIVANIFVPQGARRTFTLNSGELPLEWLLSGTSSGHSLTEVSGTEGYTMEYRTGTQVGVDVVSVTDNLGRSSSVQIRVVDPGTATGIQGDVDGDGDVDIEDVRLLRDYLVNSGKNALMRVEVEEGTEWPEGGSHLDDANDDGQTDLADLVTLVQESLETK